MSSQRSGVAARLPIRIKRKQTRRASLGYIRKKDKRLVERLDSAQLASQLASTAAYQIIQRTPGVLASRVAAMRARHAAGHVAPKGMGGSGLPFARHADGSLAENVATLRPIPKQQAIWVGKHHVFSGNTIRRLQTNAQSKGKHPENPYTRQPLPESALRAATRKPIGCRYEKWLSYLQNDIRWDPRAIASFADRGAPVLWAELLSDNLWSTMLLFKHKGRTYQMLRHYDEYVVTPNPVVFNAVRVKRLNGRVPRWEGLVWMVPKAMLQMQSELLEEENLEQLEDAAQNGGLMLVASSVDNDWITAWAKRMNPVLSALLNCFNGIAQDNEDYIKPTAMPWKRFLNLRRNII